MHGSLPLERLCAHYHIATSYQDSWGGQHTVSPEILRALLTAMGVKNEQPGDEERALLDAEIDTWCRPLPPVQVVWEGEKLVAVTLGTRESQLSHRFRWTLRHEDGSSKSAEFCPADLDLLGENNVQGERWQQRRLMVTTVPAPGYHRLELHNLDLPDAPRATMPLIVAPRLCYQPQAITDGRRVWGPTIQLYAVRSARNWGIGDYTDLLHVVEISARAGAGMVGVNPLHALFPQDPVYASPYKPSSRLFLNILYLDVESIADFAESAQAQRLVSDGAFQARLRALRATELVDYAGVATTKLEILETLYRHFRQHHLRRDSERARAFVSFQKEQGEALHQHATYEALRAWRHDLFLKKEEERAWPKPYQHPDTEAVTKFIARHEEWITFFEYLQWQAHLQLGTVGQRAYDLGLGVGLYQDLTVGVDPYGAELWTNQQLFASSCHIGVPPDDDHPQGQDWRVPPWLPHPLREQGYAPFIKLLQKNMRVAGALRFDHIVSLMRLFCLPPGRPPAEGTYVDYPYHDLLAILALESQRNRCLVIGDDLGSVPAELREQLHLRGVLSYRLLYYEKAFDGSFKTSNEYEPQALIAINNHDQATLAGYWQGRDLELRGQLGLFHTPESRELQLVTRAEERTRLLVALEREGLVSEELTIHQVAAPEMSLDLAEAIHRYLARTPAQLMAVPMEDVLGQSEQINLPGSSRQQYPNWCRKLLLELELWSDEPRVQRIFNALRDERGSSVIPPQSASVPPPEIKEAEIPLSTYRLQLHRGFTFDDAAQIVPYLHSLGISHCYTSPSLQARPGSSHGYDIIDHGKLNDELNGDAAFIRFSDAIKERGMGLIMDIVPNHMGVMGSDNGWWLDVLENGPASLYASFFDIDWVPLKDELRAKVLLPVLGDHYGKVLDRGELELRFHSDKGAFSVHYFKHEFPIDPGEYPSLLGHDIERLEKRLGSQDLRLLEFQSLITALGNLPPRSKRSEIEVAERSRDKELHKVNLARQCRDADIAHYLAENIALFNSNSGVELLHELLERQAWRLAYWQVASDEINYRRFFDINELAGLRMENEQVFAATHKRIIELIGAGRVQGLRIDHPDGLFEPANYFRRLQSKVAAPHSLMVSGQDNAQLDMPQARPLYLLVEKILARHERLRQEWAVHGTTGYDFTNQVNGLFVDAATEAKMERTYRDFIGETSTLEEQIYSCKKLIMRVAMASELNVLAHQLSLISELDRHTRDFTLNSLRGALSEVVALFPVYRTYVASDSVSAEDRHYVEWAIKLAKKRSTASDITIFDFVHEVLLTSIGEGKSEEYKQQVTAFALKFQQYTGPVMAKGLEDTTFYRYNRLISLNEVGGEPSRFANSVSAFHHQNQERCQSWPHTMLSTSTHDSKRSEDVRARINVLSELPDEWRMRVRRWARVNHKKTQLITDQRAPSRDDEYLLYQTLVGSWPLETLDATALDAFRERTQAYMLKAVKEAKVHTSWINPNSDYEQAMHDFINSLLGDLDNNRFLADFLPFQQSVSRIGLFNSLAQTLLKLTSPGVPDIYQGCELWNFTLVDPDNRRPVDYHQRQALLTQLQEKRASAVTVTTFVDELTANLQDGRTKLYLTWRTLQLRQDNPDLFRDGDYLPLQISGPHAEHLCVFARRHGDQTVVVAVPRLIYRLAGGAIPLGDVIWGATTIELPGGTWRNWLTDEPLEADNLEGSWQLSAGRLLRHFPVALLVSDG
ncbi:MAG TPA: malto-oligosyltrehalose synthase [Gammaproteobacteria bacterium]